MTDRNASATIKGYFYQFDQTIVRLLEASEHASVVVEGIEDIDVADGNESALIQCKYYEGSEYNHSLIKDAIIHMIKHFHARGCPSDHVPRYRLYGHYKSGHTKLVLPLTSGLMKDSFLSYTRDKVAHRVHEELGMSDAQIDIFCTLLDIDIHGQSYEDQQKKLVKLLIDKISGCSDADALTFYYPCAINVVQGLAIEADANKRKITRKRFLNEIDRKEAVFSSWLTHKFGAHYYARLIRRKHFRSKGTKLAKASRIFVIDMLGEFDAKRTATMIATMGEFFSHKEHVRTSPQDRFAPYVHLRGISAADLASVKATLWERGVSFSDGYPHLDSEFSASLLVSDPTKENLWRVKFISFEDQLVPTISAMSGTSIELYDLHKTSPIDGSQCYKRAAVYPIRCPNSYFIQEVIQS